MRRTLLAPLLLLAACATKSELRGLPMDIGAKAAFPQPLDKVKKAAMDSSAEIGFVLKEEAQRDTSTWYFIGSQGIGSSGAGRLVRVAVHDDGAQRTVYVLVRAKIDTQEARLTDELLANDILKKTAGRLAAK